MMKKQLTDTNTFEDEVIKAIDGDREEQPKRWCVTNLPNGEPDRLFVSKASAEMWAIRYKWKHNLSNPKVEKING